MSETFDRQRICLLIAEKLREIATRQGVVPFKTGWLRKAHVVQPYGDGAVLSVNLPYARAVHDGRPAITIYPRKGKALAFPAPAGWRGKVGKNGKVVLRSVRQPARKGRPWLRDSIQVLHQEGYEFLAPYTSARVIDEVRNAVAGSPHIRFINT